MFYTSVVEPHIEPDKNCRGRYFVMGYVKYYKDGKFVRWDDTDYLFGVIYDDDYIDEEKLLAAMNGKTVYEAHRAFVEFDND